MPSRRILPNASPPPIIAGRRRREHGQSLVEFALVIPIMLYLVVAIADFGRIFAFGVALEGAARSAAEAVSTEYLANSPGALNAAAAPTAGYYDGLHLVGARVVCANTRDLPGVAVDTGTGTCPGMPYAVICVHDGADDACSAEVNGASIPAECDSLTAPPTNAQADGTRRYVEVRTCYRFESLLELPLLSFGTLWLQRARVFDIPCYFQLGPAECG